MLWACICLCFFSFLRAGEAVIQNASSFDPSQHLSFPDISVDSMSQPSFIRVRLKQSKTDPFKTGVNVIVGRTNGPLCPVAAILSYMAKKGPEPGPLFQFADSWPLTWPRLVSSLREVLQKVGIDCSKYSDHSFQIGAATMTVALGILDC